MAKHATFSLQISTAVHVSGIFAALAWGSYQVELPHYHLQSGAISIEASFAAPEPTRSTYEVSLSPVREDQTIERVEQALQPLAMELRPQRLAVNTSLTRAELPTELEACNCKAPDHEAQTPKRATLDEPRPVTHEIKLDELQRVELAEIAVDVAEVELPSIESLGSDIDELARPFSTNRLPVYPRGALAVGEQAQGVVQARIGADGKVESVELAKSCGISSADQSALEAIAKWQFQPARRGGEAVASSLNVPFRFRNL